MGYFNICIVLLDLFFWCDGNLPPFFIENYLKASWLGKCYVGYIVIKRYGTF